MHVSLKPCACSQWQTCEGKIACQNVCILCLEAPVVKESFRLSPRLFSRPFTHPTGCLLVSLSLTTVLYLRACVSMIQSLIPFIYRLMTVAVLSIHLYQPDDDHRCPPDPGCSPRLNRGQEPWSPLFMTQILSIWPQIGIKKLIAVLKQVR